MNKLEFEKNLNLIIKLAEECLSDIGFVEAETALEAGKGMDAEIKNTSLTTELDFSMNPRAFFKKYSKGMSGPKIFTLMVAYLAKQKGKDAILLSDVQNEWSKLKTILKSKFANSYALRAKESDWIQSPQNSTYSLRPDWQKILNGSIT